MLMPAVYLEKQFKKWNWQTNLQLGSAVTFNGKEIAIKNIVARFDTTKKSRVLLMTHWDTRPFADRDEIRKTEAIDGANDGASGVGVTFGNCTHNFKLRSETKYWN